jgi:hypothetical protein
LASFSTSLLIIEGSQDRDSNKVGTWRQEKIKRLCLALHGLLSLFFFFYRTQDPLPKSGPSHNVLDPPSTITNSENASRLVYNPLLWSTFFVFITYFLYLHFKCDPFSWSPLRKLLIHPHPTPSSPTHPLPFPCPGIPLC